MPWTELGEWWRDELADDPAYDSVTTPLLIEILRPQAGHTYLDLGCGEGRVMRAVGDRGAKTVGLDVNEGLLEGISTALVATLPDIPLKDDSVDGVYAVLVLEHLEDHGAVFVEAARVTRPDGVFCLVSNHPYWTAPGATPIEDDGEDLWRPGEYFGQGGTDIPIRDHLVRFEHRTMSEILNSAAAAGWSLETMVERPHHDHTSQSDVPRLLACRWRLLP